MKKKLYQQFALIALATILLTTLLITAVFYGVFQKEILEELKVYARVLQSTGAFVVNEKVNLENLRITVIAEDGTVLYDNDADIGILDNHGNRIEIEEALLNGEGYAIRHSDTLEENTFYYALRMENGSVLRIAKESSSIWNIFKSAFPSVLFIASCVLSFGFFLAKRATKNLMKPIEELAEHLDEYESIYVYEEMIPVVDTIRKQHEDIMKNAKMRQDFTANVSHELKTPLTAISGYAELMEHQMVTEKEIPRFAGEIHRSANRLLTMINDIIRLSELDVMETDTLIFDKVPIYQLAEHCVDMLQVSAEKHRVHLELQGSPCWIIGNREMIEETLYNLCDNAIRYNNVDGNVWMSVEPFENKVKLMIRDTGIGISKKHQERIFERFYRVDKSRSKATGGTGLGLAIVKHILVQHGAELILESEEGKGTCITILFQNAVGRDII